MNIIKIQDQLKNAPDDALIGYVQNPSGHVPTYLALSELQRRKEMRNSYQANKPEDKTVAEDLVQEAQPQMEGVVGLPAGQPMQQAMAPQPEMSMEQMAQGGLAELDTGNMYDDNNYANGGIVAFDDGGPVQNFEEGGTSRIGRWWEGYKQRSQENLAREDEIQKLQNEYYSLTTSPFTKTLPGQETAAAQRQTEIKQKINELKAAKSGASSNAPSTPPGANVLGSQAAADKMTGTLYDPSQALNIKSPPINNKPPVASDGTDPYALEKVGSIASYADELKNYLGVDPMQAKLTERMDKMDAAAAKQAEQAPWMALAKAGFEMANQRAEYGKAAETPLASAARGAGAGLKDYAESKDKLNLLEQKRFSLLNDIAQANRKEQIAVATYGANSKQAVQERNAKAKLQQAHDKVLMKMNSDDNLKALQIAQNKNQPTITESLKVQEFIAQNLPKEKQRILEVLGGNADKPGSKNHNEYNKQVAEAEIKLATQARTIPGMNVFSGDSVTSKKAKFLGFE